MKAILLLFVTTTFLTLSLRANESFPEIGKTYRVFYATKLDPVVFSPGTVRILKRGSGNWVLIEAKKSPDAIKVSFWLNFDWLISATEMQATEQAGTGQPATSSESEPEGNDKPQPESKGLSR